MPSFKDILNLAAGEIMLSGHDLFAQQIQLTIVMIGSYPFVGLF